MCAYEGARPPVSGTVAFIHIAILWRRSDLFIETNTELVRVAGVSLSFRLVDVGRACNTSFGSRSKRTPLYKVYVIAMLKLHRPMLKLDHLGNLETDGHEKSGKG